MISIIIPLYNKQATVARAIQSVLDQSHDDFTLLIVNDGSTDNSAAIARGFDDPRIQVIDQPNGGPGNARNTGIRAASDALVAFLDADDEWEPQYLEVALRRLADHPDCTAHVSGYYIGPDRRSREALNRKKGIRPGPFSMPSVMAPERLKFMSDAFHSSCVVAQRAMLLSYGGFFDAFRCLYAEDSYLWLQVMLNETVYMDPAPMVWFHTEFSDLGAALVGRHPRRPALTHPDPLEARIRPGQRANLQRLLAWYRLGESRALVARAAPDAPAEVRRLQDRFPYPGPFSARFSWQMLKLRRSLGRLPAPEVSP